MPLLSLLRRKTGGVGVYKEGVKKVSLVYSAFGSKGSVTYTCV